MHSIPATRALWLAAGAVSALGVGLVSYGALHPAPGAVEVRLSEAATASPTDGRMKVYVAGAVLHPGVYAVQPGDRVADALEAAGGPTDDADTLAINLARRLRDEDAVIVPRQGDPAPVRPVATG